MVNAWYVRIYWNGYLFYFTFCYALYQNDGVCIDFYLPIIILGSVKLHIGDSWGKMQNFALGHFQGETQTLGGSVIGSFALECVFGELWPFFPFSVMADTNFPFLFTLRKLKTQILGGQ